MASLLLYYWSVAPCCYRICNSTAPSILLYTSAELWVHIQLKTIFTMAWRRKESPRQSWFTIKYIKAVPGHQTHHFPMRYHFSYVFQSVPGVNESRKFCLKPIKCDYTSCHWNSTFSIKAFLFLSLPFPPSLSLSLSLSATFNEILIKIRFNAQAKRQITLQSWDKMKLLTETMGSSNSHAGIKNTHTHEKKTLATFSQDICNERDILLSNLINQVPQTGFYSVCACTRRLVWVS